MKEIALALMITNSNFSVQIVYKTHKSGLKLIYINEELRELYFMNLTPLCITLSTCRNWIFMRHFLAIGLKTVIDFSLRPSTFSILMLYYLFIFLFGDSNSRLEHAIQTV